MARYLVTFVSAPLASGVVDASAFSVRARTRVAAIAARKDVVPHPWVVANATPWPEGVKDAEDALAIVMANTAA